jgi:hypothetical protein
VQATAQLMTAPTTPAGLPPQLAAAAAPTVFAALCVENAKTGQQIFIFHSGLSLPLPLRVIDLTAGRLASFVLLT